MQKLVSQITPFILMGIALVAFAFGIVLLAYLFLFGALVGFILFIISVIRDRFFSPKKVVKPHPRPGRIIDSNDWKEL